jgi:hypothetical protein
MTPPTGNGFDMTTFTQTKHLAKTTRNAPSALADISLRKSWPDAPVTPAGVRRSFDPEAAGRRAVRKHGEALRRLSD